MMPTLDARKINTKTALQTTQKTTQKTVQKIIALIRQNPEVTRQELAMELEITDSGVKYHLKKMQDKHAKPFLIALRGAAQQP